MGEKLFHLIGTEIKTNKKYGFDAILGNQNAVDADAPIWVSIHRSLTIFCLPVANLIEQCMCVMTKWRNCAAEVTN